MSMLPPCGPSVALVMAKGNGWQLASTALAGTRPNDGPAGAVTALERWAHAPAPITMPRIVLTNRRGRRIPVYLPRSVGRTAQSPNFLTSFQSNGCAEESPYV